MDGAATSFIPSLVGGNAALSESWCYTVTHAGETTEVVGAEAIAGRSRSCDITVADASVSRRHARLATARDALIVEDLGSSNGTAVNDQPTYGRTTLRDGDRLRLGDAELTVAIRPVEIQPKPPAGGFGDATMFLQQQSVDLAARIEELTSTAAPAANRPPAAPFAAGFTPTEAVFGDEETETAIGDEPPVEAATSPLAMDTAARPAPSSSGARKRWPDSGEFASIPTPPMPIIEPPEPPPADAPAARMPAAGAVPRIAAWLIDSALLAMFGLVLWLVLGLNERPEGWQTAMLAAAAAGLLVLIAGWSLWGTTPGKRSLGLYVCTRDGRPGIGFLRATVRAAGWLLSLATLGIGFALAAGAQRLALHDRIAGTYVGMRPASRP